MTALDAALMIEADAKKALQVAIDRLDGLVAETKHAVLCGLPPPVKTLHAKAIAVQEAVQILDATRAAARRYEMNQNR